MRIIVGRRVGGQVIIRYGPSDLAEIRVYHQEHFLCRAVCQELAGQTISLKEVIRARNARRRQLREHIGARMSIADQLLPGYSLPDSLSLLTVALSRDGHPSASGVTCL